MNIALLAFFLLVFGFLISLSFYRDGTFGAIWRCPLGGNKLMTIMSHSTLSFLTCSFFCLLHCETWVAGPLAGLSGGKFGRLPMSMQMFVEHTSDALSGVFGRRAEPVELRTRTTTREE